MRNRILKLLGLSACFILALAAAYYVSTNIGAQAFVARFGYAGVLLLAFLSGLNVVIPIPPESFVPVFLAAGMTSGRVIAALVVGTTIADLVAYALGWYGGKHLEVKKTPFFKKLDALHTKNPAFALGALFLWAAIVPLPNEVLLIPLGMMGLHLRTLALPFLLGNIVHYTLVVYGFLHFVPFL